MKRLIFIGLMAALLAGCASTRGLRHREAANLCEQVYRMDLGPRTCWTKSRILYLALRDGLEMRDVLLMCMTKGDIRHAVVLYDGVVYDASTGVVAPWSEIEARGWRVVECPPDGLGAAR